VYFTNDFNQVFDGVVYGVMVALGFSLIENCGYFFSIQQDHGLLLSIIIILTRGLITTTMHVTATGIMGYYVGKSKFASSGSRMLIFKGVALAAMLHGLFNVLAVFPYGLYISIPILIAIFFIFRSKWNRPDVRMVWRPVSKTVTNTI